MEETMPALPLQGARLAGALLLALALPLSAQSPESGMPEALDEADTVAEVDAAEATDAPAPPADPALLDAEMLPRTTRSLLLDAVATDAGYVIVGERGHVLVSQDGKEWKQAAIPTRATLTTVAATEGAILAAGHDGVIVQSTDGGQTWERRRAAPWSYDIVDPSEGVPVLDLFFTDSQNGFAIGAYSLMLVTSDGGATWEARPLELAGEAGGAGQDVADEQDDAPVTDGSDWTFSEDDLALDAESDPHLNAMTQAGSGALVIAGERGTFMRSRDGGLTWDSKRLPYEGSMFGVIAWEDEHIMVFGLRGNVLESRDLGDTWTPVETGISTSLMGGRALPGGGAILVGANGAVLTRPDGNSPFTATTFEMSNGETPLLSSVLPLDDGGYLVIGDKGADLYRPE
jgi:photosystem II stability/assembly factor-like uncharacterized protein